MIASDIMTSPVIFARPDASVRDVAELLLNHRISAVPIVHRDGKIAGIITEGDLMHRAEAGTQRRRSWWVRAFAGETTMALDYAKANSRHVPDLMTKDVVTVAPETPLNEIAELLEARHIKRVPVVTQAGELVGIVSRSNLVQAIVLTRPSLEMPPSDKAIREKLSAKLSDRAWSKPINITVSKGVVDLWGLVDSEEERHAIRVAAENSPGVVKVNDRLFQRPVDWE